MSPSSASLPSAPTPSANPMPVGTTVVDNIPVHMPTAPVATRLSEDEELDKIMRDVGHELKKETKKPEKHGLLHFGHKAKKEPPFSAQTVRLPQLTAQTTQPPMPAAAPPMPATESIATAKPAAQPQQTAQSKPTNAVTAKPKSQTTKPVFVIFVTLLATGFLIAAAIAAYRQT